MDVTEAVSTEAGHIVVLNKVLALELFLVVLVPVAVHRQHLACATVNGHDVWQCDAILILIAGHVVVHLNLKELVAVIVSNGVALLFGLLFFHVVVDHYWLA